MKKIYLYLFLAIGLLAECSLSASDYELSQDEISFVETDGMLDYEYVGSLDEQSATEIEMYQYALFYYMKNSKMLQATRLVDKLLRNCDVGNEEEVSDLDEERRDICEDFLISILEGMYQRKDVVTEEDRFIIRKFETVSIFPQYSLRKQFRRKKDVSEPFIDFIFEKVKINVDDQCFISILCRYEASHFWSIKDIIKKCIMHGVGAPEYMRGAWYEKYFDEVVLELTLQKRPFLPSSHPAIRLYEMREREFVLQCLKEEREKECKRELLRQKQLRQEKIKKDEIFALKMFPISSVDESAEREAKRLKLSGKDPMWNT